jgi:hypothetical protein
LALIPPDSSQASEPRSKRRSKSTPPS